MEKIYTGKSMRFAHTGVTQYAPENSIEAFKEAARIGCEGIELDINMCGDGEIIVTHNSNLGYMTFEKDQRLIKDLSVEDIKKVDIPYRNALKRYNPPAPWTEHLGGRRVQLSDDDPECRVTHLSTFPEIDEWLSTVPYKLNIEVEFKAKGMCKRMDEIISKSKVADQYIFFSGNREVLDEMQEHYRKNGKPDGLRLGANIRFINEKTMNFVKNADLYEVGLNDGSFSKDTVDMFESMGIKVFSNLGDYVEWWSRLDPMGVAGFKTNYPEAFVDWYLSEH